MAKKVTKIKATDSEKKPAAKKANTKAVKKPAETKKVKKVEKAAKVEKAKTAPAVVEVAKTEGKKKPFILFRPFVAFWHYLKDAWKELRQVRWPNRRASLKMVLAVLVYTAIFMILITLLDLFFRWLLGLILGN